MSSNGAITSSAALTELQSDLKSLSASLGEISDVMNSDMGALADTWQDAKYEDFTTGFKPYIEKCREISERYSEWCTSVLQPTIDNAVEIERADVVGNGAGASVGAGTPAGNTAGATAATSGTTSGLNSKFNMGGNVSASGNASVASSVDTGSANMSSSFSSSEKISSKMFRM